MSCPANVLISITPSLPSFYRVKSTTIRINRNECRINRNGEIYINWDLPVEIDAIVWLPCFGGFVFLKNIGFISGGDNEEAEGKSQRSG